MDAANCLMYETVRESSVYYLGFKDGKKDAVAHGKWEHGNNANRVNRSGDYEEWYTCTVCDCDTAYCSDYCPNCGAKMDGAMNK